MERAQLCPTTYQPPPTHYQFYLPKIQEVSLQSQVVSSPGLPHQTSDAGIWTYLAKLSVVFSKLLAPSITSGGGGGGRQSLALWFFPRVAGREESYWWRREGKEEEEEEEEWNVGRRKGRGLDSENARFCVCGNV